MLTSEARSGGAPGPDEAARLRGLWLVLARTAVVVYGVGFLVLFIIGVPVRFQALTTVCASVETCRALYLSQLEVAAMPGWLTIEAYAGYQTTLEMVLMVIGLSVAALLLYRHSHTRMGLLAATVTIWTGTAGNVIPALAESVPLVAAIYWPLNFVGTALLWLFVLVFPDGRIEPAWVRRRFPLILIPVLVIFLLASVDPQGLTPVLRFGGEGLFYVGLFYVAILFPLTLQVVRYRRHASPEQRQQVKWGLVGLAGMVLAFLLWGTIEPVTSPFPGGTPRLTWYLLGILLTVISVSLLPVTLAYSILRRRLWDIDLIINRAVVYGSLTVTIAVIYLGTVVLLQRIVLSGQQSPLVVAGSTLLIAALFAPLRRCIQAFIDRRFYRSKYDGQKALAAFAATARSQVDLDALTTELLRVVGDTVQPQRLGVWLRPATGRERRDRL